jgi:hypothetical protein
VQTAIRVDAAAHHLFTVVPLRHVGTDERRIAARCLDRGDSVFAGVVVDI